MAEVDLLFPENRRVLAEAPEIPHEEAPEGLIEEREGTCLYTLARRAQELGNIVEIGAFEGRSTWYLARALDDVHSRRHIVSIDPHVEGTQDTYDENLASTGIGSLVEAHTARSHDVARDMRGPVGLVWIDGDHSYNGVRLDFEDWFPKLAIGGWIAMHDTVDSWYGPTRLVRELLLHRSDLACIGVIGTMTFACKVAPSMRNRVAALRARFAFELVTVNRWRAFGVGARHRAPGEAPALPSLR